jgi:hypothetical protein
MYLWDILADLTPQWRRISFGARRPGFRPTDDEQLRLLKPLNANMVNEMSPGWPYP